MTEGSEFKTEVAAMLKLRKAKVAWTRGTDNRMVLDERREHAGMWRIYCAVSYEANEDAEDEMGATRERARNQQQPNLVKCILDALKQAGVFLSGTQTYMAEAIDVKKR